MRTDERDRLPAVPSQLCRYYVSPTHDATMQIHSCRLRRAIKTCSLQHDSFLILSLQQQPFAAVFTLCPYLFGLLFPHWVQISQTRRSHRQKATCDLVLCGLCGCEQIKQLLFVFSSSFDQQAVTKTLRYDPTGPRSKCTHSTCNSDVLPFFVIFIFSPNNKRHPVSPPFVSLN